eukprot:9202179-Pyramimonas_sp.AAC.1
MVNLLTLVRMHALPVAIDREAPPQRHNPNSNNAVPVPSAKAGTGMPSQQQVDLPDASRSTSDPPASLSTCVPLDQIPRWTYSWMIRLSCAYSGIRF